MTVKELREQLAELSDDLIVVISKDCEGYEYTPLPNDGWYSRGVYLPDTACSGEVYHENTEGYEFATDDPYAVPCITIWPRG